MVDYGKTLSNAFRFSFDPKRWLPLFALDVITGLAVLSYLISNVLAVTEIVGAAINGLEAAYTFFGIGMTLASIFAVWSLLRLFITGSLIHQSEKPKEIGKSFTVSKDRYFSLLAASIVLGLLSTLLSMIPYVGWLFSLITSIIFFLAMPAVVAGKLGFMDALRDSYMLFREKLSDFIIGWLLISVVAAAVAMIFVIPTAVIAIGTLIPAFSGLTPEATGDQIISIILDNGWTLIPAMVVVLLGTSISSVFTINAQTHLYLQLKKKKHVIF